VASGLPSRFAIPDLSELDDHLTDNLLLSMLIGRGFPEGDAQHLVTAFVRTTESALRLYEAARMRFDAAAAGPSLASYLRGLDEMELTYMALTRAMRLAVALVESPDTKVSKRMLPSQSERDRLRKMRDAIEHREGPIKASQAGIGKTIALSVRETESAIERDSQRYVARHDELASWIKVVHALAVKLTNEPHDWSR
jgi:DNA repair protein RadC